MWVAMDTEALADGHMGGDIQVGTAWSRRFVWSSVDMIAMRDAPGIDVVERIKALLPPGIVGALRFSTNYGEVTIKGDADAWRYIVLLAETSTLGEDV